LCVNSCPTGILFLNAQNKIRVKEIAQCIFCGICEARCPDFAIWVVKPTQEPKRTYDALLRTEKGE
jgi:2-oxoglutarate ferredoxin oxidoreductase subunit delta